MCAAGWRAYLVNFSKMPSCVALQGCILGNIWSYIFVLWNAWSLSCPFWGIWDGPRRWELSAKIASSTRGCWFCFCGVWKEAAHVAGCCCLQGNGSYYCFPYIFTLCSYLILSHLMQPPPDALFAHPRLFRACVPPGMHRFRGNIWDFDSRPKVMNTLGYPLPMNDRIPEITEARNIELGLGLQVTQHRQTSFSPLLSFISKFLFNYLRSMFPIFYIVSLLKFYFLWQLAIIINQKRKLIHK